MKTDDEIVDDEIAKRNKFYETIVFFLPNGDTVDFDTRTTCETIIVSDDGWARIEFNTQEYKVWHNVPFVFTRIKED